MRQNRRHFLKRCAALATGVMCGGTILTSCAGIPVVSHRRAEGKLVIARALFAERNDLLVRDTQLPTAVYVIQKNDNHFAAILLQCTHQQCEVAPLGHMLACPCHGSEYNNSGQVTNGPAERDLTQFPVSADEDNVYIEIG